MKVSFKLNGKKTNVDVSSDTPLLWVLRDTLAWLVLNLVVRCELVLF